MHENQETLDELQLVHKGSAFILLFVLSGTIDVASHCLVQ